ncbi:MAG: hypothetical protein IKJ99_06345 [Oscillospiraceae bacterium]|nr:hypothetical protein [Oscillospiraceae bacterium]
MEQKKSFKKPRFVLLAIVLIIVIIAVCTSFDFSGSYDHGIYIRFEEDTTVMQEQMLLEIYENAVILDADDPILHDYTLVFPNLSERRVMDIVLSLNEIGCVRDASYVRVMNP